MAYWDNGALRVSDNRKYLRNGGTPFFWMGDTAWLLMQQCDREEAFLYLKNRKDKGFNVIQATLVHSLPGENMSSLARISKDVTAKEYWDHCVEIVGMAQDLGLYMALLPTWGSIVKSGIFREEDIVRYAEFLNARFSGFPNIIWILGGDIRGSVNIPLYDKFGHALKERMPDKLAGFHPFGRTSSSLWFHDREWLDFNMFQSGHRRYDQPSLNRWDDGTEEFYGEDNWKYVIRDHSYGIMKPTLDGEPSYEQIPQGLHDPREPYWQAEDVRRYAYWSVFQGAMGHTYGDNAIMQFYSGRSGEGNYGVRERWDISLHHEGSSHMKHLADLIKSVDYENGAPADGLLLSGQKEKYDRVAVFAGKDYLLAYDYTGHPFEINIAGLECERKYAYWHDPVSGVYSFFGDVTRLESVKAEPPKKRSGQNDWTLVVKGGSSEIK